MRVAVRNVLASFGPMYHEYIVTRKACHGLSEHCTGAILGVERKSSEPFRDPMRCDALVPHGVNFPEQFGPGPSL
jgi:hypothetical protein